MIQSVKIALLLPLGHDLHPTRHGAKCQQQIFDLSSPFDSAKKLSIASDASHRRTWVECSRFSAISSGLCSLNVGVSFELVLRQDLNLVLPEFRNGIAPMRERGNVLDTKLFGQFFPTAEKVDHVLCFHSEVIMSALTVKGKRYFSPAHIKISSLFINRPE